MRLLATVAVAVSLIVGHATPSDALNVNPTLRQQPGTGSDGNVGAGAPSGGSTSGGGNGDPAGGAGSGGIGAPGGRTADCPNGQPGDVIVADNQEQTVYYTSELSQQMATASTWALNNQYAPLDTNVNYLSSVDSLTDVVVYQQFYTNGRSGYCSMNWFEVDANGNHRGKIVGLTTCVSKNSVGECEKHEVRYDSYATNTYGDDKLHDVACHELGHSFGLLHSPSGCMYLDIVGNPSLSAADGGLINWWYDPSTACCDKVLNGDQSLTSPSGDWRLIMQGDGNLVGYHRRQNDNGNDTPFWATGTDGHPGATAVMQADGNLVIYWQGNAIWTSGTQNNQSAVLSMQSDRNIVIYRCCGGGAAWNSGTKI